MCLKKKKTTPSTNIPVIFVTKVGTIRKIILAVFFLSLIWYKSNKSIQSLRFFQAGLKNRTYNYHTSHNMIHTLHAQKKLWKLSDKKYLMKSSFLFASSKVTNISMAIMVRKSNTNLIILVNIRITFFTKKV